MAEREVLALIEHRLRAAQAPAEHVALIEQLRRERSTFTIHHLGVDRVNPRLRVFRIITGEGRRIPVFTDLEGAFGFFLLLRDGFVAWSQVASTVGAARKRLERAAGEFANACPLLSPAVEKCLHLVDDRFVWRPLYRLQLIALDQS